MDKYYTSPELASYVVEKTKEIIGEENITEYIEPSAGAGVFLDYLDKPYLAYDIEPEDNRVRKQDYMELELSYKKGRCVIGNPPYGIKNNLTVAFYKKSIEIADYISFILPISQYNNRQKLYEFDLLYSEDLGVKNYSNREIHCCLNIYRRNPNGLNKRPDYKLKDIEIREHLKNKNPKRARMVTKEDFNYDIRIMAWGGGVGRKNQLGCEVEHEGQFTKEFCIKIHNDKHKDKVLDIIRNTHWESVYPMTATPNLLQWQVYKYLKEQIPELK